MLVGEPLPGKFFDLSQNARVTAPLRRRCKHCNFIWRTVEIPVMRDWPEDLKVTRCPTNPVHRGLVKSQSDIKPKHLLDFLADDKFITPGVLRAILLGANHRRRMCNNPECRTKKGKVTAWTTMEVSPSGLIVADISACPRCEKDSVRVWRREEDFPWEYHEEEKGR